MYDLDISASFTGQFNTVARRENSYNGLENSHNNIMDVFKGGGGPTQQAVTETPDVSRISDKNFHVSSGGAASSKTVSSAGAAVADTGGMKSEANAVKADYLQTDRNIKAVVSETMKQEFGHKDAGNAMKQTLPGGGITKMQGIMTIADPTGIAGSVYAVLDTIISENKRLPNAKVNAMMETTLNRLRQSSEAAQHGDMNEARKLVPEGMNFDDVNWSELKAFLERNPENDPVMQEVRGLNEAADAIEQENSLVRGHDHREGDMAEKAILAVDAGDQGAAMEFASDQVEADAIMAGADIQEVFQSSAAEIEYQVASLADLSGIKADAPAIASLGSAWGGANPDAVGPSQSIEYDTTRLLGMNSAA